MAEVFCKHCGTQISCPKCGSLDIDDLDEIYSEDEEEDEEIELGLGYSCNSCGHDFDYIE